MACLGRGSEPPGPPPRRPRSVTGAPGPKRYQGCRSYTSRSPRTLLFPRDDGLFRSESALKKAFAEVGRLIGLKKKFSPRGMRRTFNDLARAAKVESLVTKSISGHLTDRMKDHYSTVSPIEQRDSIGRVLDLVQREAIPSGAAASGAPGGAPDPSSGAPEEGAAS